MSKAVLKIPSSTGNIAKLEPFLKRVVAEHNICQGRYADILISLTEAVNNAIIHGNGRDEKKFVIVDLQIADHSIVFTVTDEGKGFDPESVPDPTQEELIECCGGRGVFIIKSLADRVQYRANGSTVCLQFTRQSLVS